MAYISYNNIILHITSIQLVHIYACFYIIHVFFHIYYCDAIYESMLSIILHDKYDVGIGFLFKILAEKGKMLLHIASLAINPNASKDSRIT